jgi:hypothetical protein
VRRPSGHRPDGRANASAFFHWANMSVKEANGFGNAAVAATITTTEPSGSPRGWLLAGERARATINISMALSRLWHLREQREKARGKGEPAAAGPASASFAHVVSP